jgi:hypothetical protein
MKNIKEHLKFYSHEKIERPVKTHSDCGADHNDVDQVTHFPVANPESVMAFQAIGFSSSG